MAEKWTDLPTVSNASLSDIICAVQGYVSPSDIGDSVQETWQQVFNLFNQNVGQSLYSNVPDGSAIALTTATPINITSILLTSGDWDLWGNVTFNSTGTTNPFVDAWMSPVSASLPDASNYSRISVPGGPFNLQTGIVCPHIRMNVNANTTVYLSAQSTFTGGATTACGSIFARRVKPFN